MFKKIGLILLTVVFSAHSFAAGTPGLSELIKNYQYAVMVEWDQRDQVFLQAQQAEFTRGLEQLVAQGAKPADLLEESLSLIPNESIRFDMLAASRLTRSQDMTSSELSEYFNEQLQVMNVQGSSWSPVTKILLGVVVTYVVLKLLMITIMYWDTDPNYGQVDNPPKSP